MDDIPTTQTAAECFESVMEELSHRALDVLAVGRDPWGDEDLSVRYQLATPMLTLRVFDTLAAMPANDHQDRTIDLMRKSRPTMTRYIMALAVLGAMAEGDLKPLVPVAIAEAKDHRMAWILRHRHALPIPQKEREALRDMATLWNDVYDLHAEIADASRMESWTS